MSMSLIELETTKSRADGAEVNAPTESTAVATGPSDLAPDTRVEVRSRFDHKWSVGFEVIAADDLGYRIRRLSDGAELPSSFTRDEIRRERKRGQWWY
jgi:hypothetical protein